ncbi:MAG: dynamin family protein [Candidatus Ozemobacteraceae bacterium]
MNLAEYRAFQTSFLEVADEGRKLAERAGFVALIHAFDALELRIREERFYLTVLGEIKRGKSSLINAFLGADILPKAATICTAALCIIGYGETPRVTVRYRDGTEVQSAPDELKMIVTRKNQNISTIERVEIEHPLPLLRDGVIIIDTPGVNDTDAFRRRVTEEFIPRSDGVIFVLNAGQPLSDSEARFLADEVLARHIKKVWFVVNGIDRLANDAERSEAIAYCEKHLRKLVPEARLYPLSAKEARRAQDAGDDAAVERSGVPVFLAVLEKELIESRRRSLFDVPLGSMAGILDDIGRGFSWTGNFLNRDAERLADQARIIVENAAKQRLAAEKLLARFRGEIEAAIHEISVQVPFPTVAGLGTAVERILFSDLDDIKKQAELEMLLTQRQQLYAAALMESLHDRVVGIAAKIGSELSRLIEGLSVSSSPFPSDVAKERDEVGQQGLTSKRSEHAEHREDSERVDASISEITPKRDEGSKPEKTSKVSGAIIPLAALEMQTDPVAIRGIRGRTLLSGFGRTASLVFLLQGNLPLAALSLAAGFLGRLGSGSASSITKALSERLRENAGHIQEKFIKNREFFAKEYERSLAAPFERISQLLNEVTQQASHPPAASELEQRRLDLNSGNQTLEILRKKCLDLASHQTANLSPPEK